MNCVMCLIAGAIGASAVIFAALWVFAGWCNNENRGEGE